VLICERALPDPGTAAVFDDKEIRTADVYVMDNLDGRERSEQDIFNLFKETDESFKPMNAYEVESTT